MESSKFCDLFKNSSKLTEKQSDRRKQLLQIQKEKRNANNDSNRGISNVFTDTENQVYHNRSPSNLKHIVAQHKLQLSEWFMERPEDIYENWLVVPCPVGQRCLLIIIKARAYVINKKGKVILDFSIHPSKALHATVLDCIFLVNTKQFYILDMLSYKNYDLRNCDVEFRFFWIKNKFEEDNLEHFHDKYSIVPSHFFAVDALDNFLMISAPFGEESVQLDGLLFYHKESLYMPGETPLVLWLNAFMVPEIFGIQPIHMRYQMQRPDNYMDYRSYIAEFNEKIAEKKRHNRRRWKQKPMDVEAEFIDDETIDGTELQDDLEEIRRLEME